MVYPLREVLLRIKYFGCRANSTMCLDKMVGD